MNSPGLTKILFAVVLILLGTSYPSSAFSIVKIQISNHPVKISRALGRGVIIPLDVRNTVLPSRSDAIGSKYLVSLSSSPNDDNDDGEGVVDSFDGKGFAGYLAPYALALVASVGVTLAFVNFVLLNY